MGAFKNLEITISLANAVCLDKNNGAFDSVLAVLYFNSLKNKREFDGNYQQRLEFLDMSDGVYHTSFPVINGIKYFQKEQLIKKFDHDIYAKYGVITAKNSKGVSNVNTITGKNKNSFFSYERVLADSVTYYVRGDKDVIEKLLKKLKFLGKKSSLGWGKISKIEIKEIEYDYSIVKYNKLMRNIPVDNSFGIDGDCVALFRLTHPYWYSEGRIAVKCFLSFAKSLFYGVWFFFVL